MAGDGSRGAILVHSLAGAVDIACLPVKEDESAADAATTAGGRIGVKRRAVSDGKDIATTGRAAMTAAWWRSLRGWLARSTGAAPSRLVAASRQAVAAAAASLQGEALPRQIAAHLQRGLHALALYPRLAGESTPVQAAGLGEAVARALQDRNWAARQPRRPQLLPQLIQTVNDDAASARVMAAIIGQDPVLTGNLLRIANSPAYKVHERPVESLQRAVTLVGTEGVRQIISAVLVQPVMQVQCEVFPQFSAIIWEHALLASRAAADHARTVTFGDAFAAQWLGLVQGLGASLVMRQLLQGQARGEAVEPALARSCSSGRYRWRSGSPPHGSCLNRFTRPWRWMQKGAGRQPAPGQRRRSGQPVVPPWACQPEPHAGAAGAAAFSAAACIALDLAAPAWAQRGNAG